MAAVIRGGTRIYSLCTCAEQFLRHCRQTRTIWAYGQVSGMGEVHVPLEYQLIRLETRERMLLGQVELARADSRLLKRRVLFWTRFGVRLEHA